MQGVINKAEEEVLQLIGVDSNDYYNSQKNKIAEGAQSVIEKVEQIPLRLK